MEKQKASSWRTYEGYVKQVADRVSSQYRGQVDREDLRQAGLVALVEACQRFDPARAATFGGYARLRVRGAILDAARAESLAKERRQAAAALSGGPGSGVRRPGMRRVPLAALEQRSSATYLGRQQATNAWRGGRKSIESEMMLRELVRSLRRRMRCLRASERQAVEAYDLEGLSFAAAGRRIGLSPAGVFIARRRGLQRLRESFC